MPKPLTLEEVEEKIFIRHGDSITMSNYINCAQDLADFKCNVCDRVWQSTPYFVYGKNGGHGCARCNGAIKYTLEEVREIVEQRGCELISKKYFNNGKKLKIKFQCGHIRNINLRDFSSGKRCPCLYKKEKKEKTKKETMQFVLDSFVKLNFELVCVENLEGGKRGVKVGYICPKNHFVPNQNLSTILILNSCKECSAERVISFNTGSGKYKWKGRNQMISFMRTNYLKDFYRESWENCNYKCVISGKPMQVVHHLYPFNEILKESLEELGMKETVNITKFSLKERKLLISKLQEVHRRYPLGVCLTKELHVLFHKRYGLKNFTPDDFYKFYHDMKKEVN